MAQTAAERARRYRKHKAGDHLLCDARRCGVSAVVPVTRDAVTPAPAGLGARGRRLWRELATPATPPAQRVLMEEACRIADRLERLDAILRGESDAWARFKVGEDSDEVMVVVDRVMSEARQQAVALRQLVAELRQAAGVSKPSGQQQQGGSLRDQLAARRAARLANAAGS